MDAPGVSDGYIMYPPMVYRLQRDERTFYGQNTFINLKPLILLLVAEMAGRQPGVLFEEGAER